MAIIGKIREKSGLLLVIVGVAMLAFIMGGWKSMFGGYEDNVGIGTVYGEKIDPMKYDALSTAVKAQDAQQYMQSQREYTLKDQEASADKAWGMMVDSIILQKEFDALGITCSDKELDAYLYGLEGFSVMPDLEQNFKDPATGKFNPKLLEQRIEQMEKSADPQESAAWQRNKQQLRESRKTEKYFQLLNMGAYVTKLEAKEEYKAAKEQKNISYVLKRYSDIPDDQVFVSDEMVRKYYEEHKTEKRYEATAGRDVKYFDIQIKPNKKDSSEFSKKMDALKKGFMATSGKGDSTFVIKNSEPEFRFYNSTNQATFLPENHPKASQRKGLTFPNYMDTVFKTASVGQIVGPYNDQGKVRLAKVLGFNTNLLSVRHILISAPKGQDAKIAAAQKKADSLVKILNKDNFESFVQSVSEDPGSKQTGGKYEDFMDFEMVPEFSKFAIDNPVGKIGTVKTDYGIHIIEVLARKSMKLPILAVVQQTLEASSEAEEDIENKAYDLLLNLESKISRLKTIKEKITYFDSIAQLNQYFSRPARILDENPKIQGFETSYAEERVLKLAYGENAFVGELCSSPIKDQNRYIIAMVTSIREKGIPAFEDVEERMRIEVVKETKAKKLTKQMINIKSLYTLAQKTNSTVVKATVTFGNPQIPEAGFEPEIIGSLYSGLRDGQVSIPLKGEQGVYVIQITKTVKAPSTNNYKAERDQLMGNARAQMQSVSKQALKKLAEVKDNRKGIFK